MRKYESSGLTIKFENKRNSGRKRTGSVIAPASPNTAGKLGLMRDSTVSPSLVSPFKRLAVSPDVTAETPSPSKPFSTPACSSLLFNACHVVFEKGWAGYMGNDDLDYSRLEPIQSLFRHGFKHYYERQSAASKELGGIANLLYKVLNSEAALVVTVKACFPVDIHNRSQIQRTSIYQYYESIVKPLLDQRRSPSSIGARVRVDYASQRRCDVIYIFNIGLQTFLLHFNTSQHIDYIKSIETAGIVEKAVDGALILEREDESWQIVPRNTMEFFQ